MVQILKVRDARRQFCQLLNLVFHDKTEIVIEKNGVEMAVMIPVEELRRLKGLEMQRQERFAVIDLMRRL